MKRSWNRQLLISKVCAASKNGAKSLKDNTDGEGKEGEMFYRRVAV